jgi:hypothetical protein
MGDLRFYRAVKQQWETTRHSYCQWLGDIDIPDERFGHIVGSKRGDRLTLDLLS